MELLKRYLPHDADRIVAPRQDVVDVLNRLQFTEGFAALMNTLRFVEHEGYVTITT